MRSRALEINPAKTKPRLFEILWRPAWKGDRNRRDWSLASPHQSWVSQWEAAGLVSAQHHLKTWLDACHLYVRARHSAKPSSSVFPERICLSFTKVPSKLWFYVMLYKLWVYIIFLSPPWEKPTAVAESTKRMWRTTTRNGWRSKPRAWLIKQVRRILLWSSFALLLLLSVLQVLFFLFSLLVLYQFPGGSLLCDSWIRMSLGIWILTLSECGLQCKRLRGLVAGRRCCAAAEGCSSPHV